jgi:hypothetical protein
MLDEQGLNRIYEIDENGVIISIKTDAVHLPAVPVCPCGATVSGVRRYTVIEQLHAVPGNFDKLVAIVGRKLSSFGDQIHGHETLLADTFDSFCRSIRPLPLAATHNKECVFSRGDTIISIQNRVVSFRGKYNFRQCTLVGSGDEVIYNGEAVDTLRHSH